MRAIRQLIAVIVTLGIALTPLAACSSTANNTGPLGDSLTGGWSTYTDIDGDSGVVAYQAGPDHIWVRFESGTEYQYTEATAGSDVIDEMKRLAAAGDGLNSYISRDGVTYAQKRQPQSAGSLQDDDVTSYTPSPTPLEVPRSEALAFMGSSFADEYLLLPSSQRVVACVRYRDAPDETTRALASMSWDVLESLYITDPRYRVYQGKVFQSDFQNLWAEQLASDC